MTFREDVILIIAVIAVMIFGFFIMKRLDVFLEENRKAIEKEQEEKYSPLEFIDAENYENTISEIENFKKRHKKVAIVIFDGKNRELTDTLNDYKSRSFQVDFLQKICYNIGNKKRRRYGSVKWKNSI